MTNSHSTPDPKKAQEDDVQAATGIATNRQSRRFLGLILAALVLGPALLAAAWAVTETAIEHTSDAAFCTTCHTMAPFAKAAARDRHGGANPHGVRAICVDCHLPHDGAVRYLIAKVRTGLRDIWAQTIYPLHKPDWLGNLSHRTAFTYDSGCLSCHAELQQAAGGDRAELIAHRSYFRGTTAKACTDCHQHVGHKNLRTAITAAFPEATDRKPGGKTTQPTPLQP